MLYNDITEISVGEEGGEVRRRQKEVRKVWVMKIEKKLFPSEF
jgi:hypothetical protein